MKCKKKVLLSIKLHFLQYGNASTQSRTAYDSKKTKKTRTHLPFRLKCAAKCSCIPGFVPFIVHWIHFTGSVLASTFVRHCPVLWQARSVCVSRMVSVCDAICWSGRQIAPLAWSLLPMLSLGPCRVVVEHPHSTAPSPSPLLSGDFVPQPYSVMQSQRRTPESPCALSMSSACFASAARCVVA